MSDRAALLLVLAAACAPPAQKLPPPALTDFPDPSALPSKTELPSLFASATSTDVASDAEAFTTWRRAQLTALFAHYVYGTTPAKVAVTSEKTASLDGVVAGATWEEHTLTLGGTGQLFVAFIRPTGTPKPPVVLGVNKCGNQSLVDDVRVRSTTSFVIPACGAARGSQKTLWPLEQIVARGYAVVTFHESDAAPDAADRFAEKLRAQFRPDGSARFAWSTIALWAWALAHAAAWVDAQPDVDRDRLTVFGHSRRGKAALLAGTLSSELDAVVAHQSGTAGAALNRSLEGETIALITSAFPHWFNGVYPGFADAELKTPVDQHQLIALWAPRRVVLVDGDDDAWADPKGAKAAAEAAAPAWDLFPAAGTRSVSWQSRPGMHSVEPSDWTLFLDALGKP